MKNEFLFFDRTDFNNFRTLKSKEGYRIVSVNELLKNKEQIEYINPYDTIIDLTTILAYTNVQYMAEEFIPLFHEETIFIADKKHEELLRHELRYCFSEFKDIEIARNQNENNHTYFSLKKSNAIHKKIIDLSDNELATFFESLRESLYGHEKFKDQFIELVTTFRIFNKINEHKVLSLFLLGESGVGKTEVARTIYRCLGGTKKLAKVNFGNYSSEFSLSSLIGSARGYIGSEDGEIFIRVRDTDVGIILIDEFEKSNASLFNYFLDVLESGKIISSMAEEIDLNGFIIVFTSNISKQDFPHRISPELRSRFDYKGQFTLLYDHDKEKYVEFRVRNIVEKVKTKYTVSLPENIHEYFLQQIDVSKYNNMRDLNKRIKHTFVSYLTSHTSNNDIE